jgi:hypothetical protein
MLSDCSEKRDQRIAALQIVRVLAGILIDQIGRMNQTVLPDRWFVGKVVEEQDALTESVGTHLEAAAIGGERIIAAEPGLDFARGGCAGVVRTIVKDDLEQPAHLGQIWLHKLRVQIAIADAFEIAVGRTAEGGTIALVGLCHIDVLRILILLLIDERIPPIIIAGRDQPGEYPLRLSACYRLCRVKDAGGVIPAIQDGHIVLADRTPGDRACLRVGPAFNAGEQSFNPQAIRLDA